MGIIWILNLWYLISYTYQLINQSQFENHHRQTDGQTQLLIIKDDFASLLTWAHESAEPADGVDVAVAHRGHRDDGPVEGGGHRVEHRARLILPDVNILF